MAKPLLRFETHVYCSIGFKSIVSSIRPEIAPPHAVESGSTVILLRACALPGADFLVLGSDGAFTPPLSTAALMEFLSQRCGGDHGRAHAGGPLGTLSPPPGV